MAKLDEMVKWNYAKAWKFFTENSIGRLIPETELYVRSMSHTVAEDLRGQSDAHKKILNAINTTKTLVHIDGGSLNGKTTFAKRLAKHINASVVDIDLLCKDWIEKEVEKYTNPAQRFAFLMNMDRLTDEYLLKNLERIIKEKSKKGSVILVGAYMEVIYRSIIARVFGQYFQQTVSIYCCARSFKEIKAMKAQRDKEFGFTMNETEVVLKQYNYSKRLLEGNGIMLGFGMAASFIADNSVSDMFA